MKVLHICCNLAGSTVFPQLFESLRDAGLDQVVFVPERYRSNIGQNAPEGVETHYALTIRETDMLFFFRKAQRTVPAILDGVSMEGVTLIHAHTLFTDGSIAEALSRRTGIPYMLTLRYSDIEAIWKYEPHLRPMARRILRGARRVVFLSGASREKVISGWMRGEERNALEKKSAVIPNGILPEWLDGAPKHAPTGEVRVGFAGKYNRRKNPLTAIDAVHRASDAGKTRFVFRAVGSGPLEEEMKKRLRLGDALLGRVQGIEAMKAFYADCDVLLVPSTAETFGMVYLEAMSQGLPVLYTRGQGFDGQFPEGEVGYSVPVGDASAQADCLRKLTQDYEERSARCVERAKNYEWASVAGKWMALYAGV